MNTKTKSITWMTSVAVLLIFLSLMVYKKTTGEEDPEPMAENHPDSMSHLDETHEEKKRGPHRGWWFEEGDFAIEVSIFEKGIPPEFRVYAYVDNKLIDTKEVSVSITLSRLGKIPEVIQFHPERGYLLGDQEIYEPHSFDVLIKARYQGKSYSWHTQQIEGRIQMDAETLQRTGVELSTAGPVMLQESTDLPGEIRFNQDRFAHVVSPLSGIIIANPKRLGQNVEEGELLAVIESRELATLKGNYLAAKERFALANKLYSREKKLRDEGISAEQDYLNSEASLAEARINLKQATYVLSALGLDESTIKNVEALNRYEIRSPLSGVIINKHLVQGEAVTPEDTLFVLADLSEIWVEFTVYPQHLGSVHVGQAVTVQIAALNQSIPGTVAWIGPLVGDETRSAKAYITLKNPDRILRPGLFVNVKIEDAKADIPVAVKRSAIQTYNDWQVVFVRVGDQFEIQPIELGRQDNEWIEVTQGLDAGTEYAAVNSFLLKAELGKSSASHDH